MNWREPSFPCPPEFPEGALPSTPFLLRMLAPHALRMLRDLVTSAPPASTNTPAARSGASPIQEDSTLNSIRLAALTSLRPRRLGPRRRPGHLDHRVLLRRPQPASHRRLRLPADRVLVDVMAAHRSGFQRPLRLGPPRGRRLDARLSRLLRVRGDARRPRLRRRRRVRHGPPHRRDLRPGHERLDDRPEHL